MGRPHPYLEHLPYLPGQCWTVPCPYGGGRCLPRATSNQRFVINVGHQTLELTYPLLAASMAAGSAPESIWWQFDALPLTRELLALAFPSTRLHFGPADGPRGCLTTKSFRPSPRGMDVHQAGALRRLVWSKCGIASRPPSAPLRVRVLDRPRSGGGSKNQCRLPGPHAGGRRLSNATVAALRSQLPVALLSAGVADAPLEVVYLPDRPDSLCDQARDARSAPRLPRQRADGAPSPAPQARRFGEADVLFSPHGAHLVHIPQLSPAAVFVEVTPWAAAWLGHFASVAASIRLRRLQLCSLRPPGERSGLAEAQCGRDKRRDVGCLYNAMNCYELEVVSRNGTSPCAKGQGRCRCIGPALRQAVTWAKEARVAMLSSARAAGRCRAALPLLDRGLGHPELFFEILR